MEKIFLLHEEYQRPPEKVRVEKHVPKDIRIVPPENLLPLWEDDYERMKNSMIYGEKKSFTELIMRIDKVQKIINQSIR